ncbi:hypothetical protein PPTG_12424 [Phytophthora nicotianae INRA-310]|uniref:Uncharacterized protein n=1 Tax=Phytophthora nicotianae (strain INRA-310) TaxID=761204 RepID=W2Q4V2_PHYN3|nr:hypothetical protein PPTG_12424 [Phytophthora nicotianae INRA-310]ETN07891.1 hypothetical protein PPTG_12424 [Phytophthora nicotianae INRA-310]
MPYNSERRELLRDLDTACALSIVGDDAEERYMLWTTYLSVATSRYLYDRIGAPHRDDKFDELLALSENEFRQVTRVSKSSFAALHDYIGGNTVFNSGGTDAPHKQRPASVQIAVALARLGLNGNAACVGEFHRRFNIAAGSVVAYTKRVVAALKAVRAQ